MPDAVTRDVLLDVDHTLTDLRNHPIPKVGDLVVTSRKGADFCNKFCPGVFHVRLLGFALALRCLAFFPLTLADQTG